MKLKTTVAIAAAAGALCALAVPALAETTFYGSARVGTWYDTTKIHSPLGTPNSTTSSTDFDMRNQVTSRLGVVTNTDKLGGKVEIGVGGQTSFVNGKAGDVNQDGVQVGMGGNTAVYIRHIYGTYKFDAGTLLIGQTFQPYFFASEQVANDDNGNANDGTGGTYDGRQPQIKFTTNAGFYGLIMRPSGISAATNLTAAANGVNANAANVNRAIYLPKISLGWDGKISGIALGAGVVGQSVRATTPGANLNQQIVSVMGYVHGKAKFGPFDAYTNLAAGKNLGDMGIGEGAGQSLATIPSGVGISGAQIGTNFIEDAFTWSALLGAGYTITPMFKANLGAGYANTQASRLASGLSPKKHDDKLQAFVNFPITIAKGVFVVPEVTYRDLLFAADGTRRQKDYIYGAKWEFDF